MTFSVVVDLLWNLSSFFLQLHVEDLQEAITYMHKNKKYKKVLFVIQIERAVQLLADTYDCNVRWSRSLTEISDCNTWNIPFLCTQMVFYIEACESGSMMNHLPTDIDGESNFSLSAWNSSKAKWW